MRNVRNGSATVHSRSRRIVSIRPNGVRSSRESPRAESWAGRIRTWPVWIGRTRTPDPSVTLGGTETGQLGRAGLMIENAAPCGSATSACLPYGMSSAGRSTEPPAPVTASTEASVSSTAK